MLVDPSFAIDSDGLLRALRLLGQRELTSDAEIPGELPGLALATSQPSRFSPRTSWARRQDLAHHTHSRTWIHRRRGSPGRLRCGTLASIKTYFIQRRRRLHAKRKRWWSGGSHHSSRWKAVT